MRRNQLLVPVAAALLVASCSSAPERTLSSTLPDCVTLPNGTNPFRPGHYRHEMGQDTELSGAGFLGFLEAEAKHALEILELSGGGQNGAFGAGFLKGWSESGKRPVFDVVTGVSTGGLLATHAFLGTAKDDAVLEEIFAHLEQGDIYTNVGILKVLLGAESLMDNDPLGHLIEKYITEEVIDRVARAHDDGRRLLVATTNLDYDQTWVWDLTQLAKKGDAESRTVYRRVLRASASPPVAFAPVEIYGHLFADGATRSNLLVAGLSGTEKPGAPAFGPGNVYVIDNGKTSHSPHAISESIAEIAGASLGASMWSSMESQIAWAYLSTRARGYEFHLTSIPAEVDVGHNSLAFDPTQMRNGFDAGYELGKSEDRWSGIQARVGDFPLWMLEALDNR